MKEHPILFSGSMVRALLAGTKTQTRRIVKPQPVFIGDENNSVLGHTESALDGKCPYGQPGDRLWVRETFSTRGGAITYRASIPYGNLDCHFKPWKPSIFCTRKASRITLEIVGVRMERLQDITEADASAEGTPAVKTKGELQSDKTIKPLTISALTLYRDLWSHINGSGSWDANPWVWVIEFRRASP